MIPPFVHPPRDGAPLGPIGGPACRRRRCAASLIVDDMRTDLQEAAAGAPVDLLGRPASTWRGLAAAWGLEPYRGDQIARWVFRRQVFDLAAMTDLPSTLRETLSRRLRLRPPDVAAVYRSVDGTRRYLLALPDGQTVEAVAMPYGARATLCISSQVGCRFACRFCQTGRLGLQRSLSAGEIVGQVLRLLAEAEAPPVRTNVVFMGQGEPLDNLDAVMGSVEALQDPLGPDLSWRRITVSTVGLVPALRRLAGAGDRRPRIAVSLSATSDELRARLMPVNRKYPIAELIAALREIRWRPREQVTFEYVLLREVNDTPADAGRLADLLRGLPAKVNLIPWNPLPGMPFARPEPERIEAFRLAARAHGLHALVRYSRGADIGAACGQLQALAAR